MQSLDIIGCGNVGKALGRLWTRSRLVEVRCVLNRTLRSGRQAVEFVGAGRAISDFDRLEPADLMMISASDESVEACCRRLCQTDLLRPGVVVFHCSGSLPSTILKPAVDRGAAVASLHPVKSFADPATAAETFAGTFCALEGDPQACNTLAKLLTDCQARTFRVRPDQKTVYHAATVIVCNYLTALMETGLRCFEHAGVDRATATQIIEPIATGTLGNVLRLGPVRALTGPIARGEPSVVRRQCEALGRCDEMIQQIYQSLGLMAVELAAAQGNAEPEALATIEETLRG